MAYPTWRGAVLGLCLVLAPAVGHAQPTPNRGDPSVQVRTVEFRDVSLSSPGGGQFTFGRIAFVGFARNGNRVSANRIDVEGVKGRFGDRTIEIPVIRVTNFQGPIELFRALSEGSQEALDWASLLHTAAADSVSMEQIVDRDPSRSLEALMRGFVLSGFKDGIVQSARLANVEARSTSPNPKDRMAMKVGEIRYQGINLGEITRFTSGGGSGNAKRLLERAVVDGLDITAGPVVMHFDRFELADIDGRAPSMAPPITGAAPAGGPPRIVLGGNSEEKQRIAYVRELLQYLRIGRYSLEGLKMNIPGQGDMAIGAITLSGLSSRGAELFEVRGLNIPTPTGPAQLGRFEIERITYGALVDYAFNMVTGGAHSEPTPAQIVELAPRFSSIRLSQLAVNTPEGPVSLGSFRFDIDDRAGKLPERVSAALTALKVELGGMKPNPGREKLIELGYKQFVANAQVLLRWQPDTKALVLDNAGVSVDQVGQVDFAVRVGNVDLAGAVGNPDAAEKLVQQGIVESIELRLANLGLAERFFADVAKQSNISPQAVQAGLAAEFRQQALANFGPALAPGAADAIAAFIQSPTRIRARAVPRPGTPPLTLGEMERMPPPMLMQRVLISIEAGGN